jgi:hypothetical protein
MVKKLSIMHHNALCTPCIAFSILSHTCAFTLDPAEEEPEEPLEPAQVEDTNPEKEQGKPRCI